jgi:1,4-alpha-glucan branching enzyme
MAAASPPRFPEGLPMSLQKRYLKSRPLSKVTFRLPAAAVPAGAQVNLVGDFNDWDPTKTPMDQLKSGEFKITLELPIDRDYAFRYLINGQEWENDWEADKYAPTGLGREENSVVIV